MPLTQKSKRLREDTEESQAVNNEIIHTVNSLSERITYTLEDKLTRILETLIDLKEEVKILRKDKNSNTDTICEAIHKSSNSIAKELTTFNNKQAEMIKNIIPTPETNEQNFEKVIPNWKNILTKRKVEYWKSYRNLKLSNIYNKWLENDPVTIPKKFQPKPIRGESEFQKELKTKLATDQMKCEVELLKVHAKNHQQQYESIDRQIAHKIEEQFPSNQDNVAIWISKWQSLCKTEEDLSEDIWKKKENWYQQQELDADSSRDSVTFNDSRPTRKDHYDTNVSTNHRQNPYKPYGANKYFRTPQHTYRPDTRNNYSRIRPPYNNNNNNYRRPPNANRFQYNTTARTQFGHGQNNSLDRQNSITDLIADNFPTSGIQRTTSDPFLRTSRPQTGSRQ